MVTVRAYIITTALDHYSPTFVFTGLQKISLCHQLGPFHFVLRLSRNLLELKQRKMCIAFVLQRKSHEQRKHMQYDCADATLNFNLNPIELINDINCSASIKRLATSAILSSPLCQRFKLDTAC